MNIGSRLTDPSKRQGIKRLAPTLFALCLPVIVATFLSGSLFDLRTLQASPMMDMSDMSGMAGMAGMDNAAHASGGHGSNPDYVPAGAGIIMLSDAGFSPANLTVPAGSVVAWINSGTKAQSVQVTRPVLFGSPVLNTGNTFQYVFSSPGTYAFKTADGAYEGNVVVFAAPQTTGTGTPGGTGTPQGARLRRDVVCSDMRAYQ